MPIDEVEFLTFFSMLVKMVAYEANNHNLRHTGHIQIQKQGTVGSQSVA